MLSNLIGKLAASPLKQQAGVFLSSINTRRDCSLTSAIALSTLTTTCIIGLSQIGLLQGAELRAFDLLVHLSTIASHNNALNKTNLTASDRPTSRITIVAIAEEDIQAQHQWPLSDAVFADLLAQLQKDKPAVIGLDIYRDIPHKPGTEALAQQLQKANVVAVNQLGVDGESEVPPPPNFPADRVGFTDVVVDGDGTVRRHFMFAALGNIELYSFSLRLAQQFLAQKNILTKAEPDAIALGNARIKPIEPNTGGYHNIDTEGYQTLIRYQPTSAIAQQLSLMQVLSDDYDASLIAEKIVIIGTTATSLQDIFQTPLSARAQEESHTPGVVIQAQLTHQLLSAALDGTSLIGTWPQWTELCWAALCGLSGGIIIWRFSHPRPIVSFTFAGIASICTVTGLLFLINHIWIPVALPLAAFAGAGASLVIYKEFRKTFYDSITRLPNRALFTQELQQRLKQSKQPVAVILLDIDGFKLFNESFGLRSGDRLLQVTAKKLRRNLPGQAKAARIAGDEFVVLLESPTHRSARKATNRPANAQTIEAYAISVAKQLAKQLSVPVDINRQKVFPSISTGIALSSHAQDTKDSVKETDTSLTVCRATRTINAEDLLRDAQTAISKAKSKGRGRCEAFRSDMRAKLSNRIWIEADLRNAIEQQELRLHYQPLVCLKTMRIAGFEALIRWQHPVRGTISPGEFIPVAEETGLIIPIGQWVLEVACAQAQQWRMQFPDAPPFISVNLSSRQFAQQDLVQQIDRILTSTRLERSALKLELTESVVMDDVEASIDILLQLKALQLKLGIDDFGTGYSSLSYLHRFPIDTLKVDRSFVIEMEAENGTAELVKTIIALGHNLGMNVVAEGIEEASQAQKLKALSCEYGQGYLFAKPVPVEEAEALLTNRTEWSQYG